MFYLFLPLPMALPKLNIPSTLFFLSCGFNLNPTLKTLKYPSLVLSSQQ